MQADHLIALDADLQVVDVNDIVYEEPNFPVVELAPSSLVWLENPNRDSFLFESMGIRFCLPPGCCDGTR